MGQSRIQRIETQMRHERVLDLYEKGYSRIDIAEVVGLAKSTVDYIIRNSGQQTKWINKDEDKQINKNLINWFVLEWDIATYAIMHGAGAKRRWKRG